MNEENITFFAGVPTIVLGDAPLPRCRPVRLAEIAARTLARDYLWWSGSCTPGKEVMLGPSREIQRQNRRGMIFPKPAPLPLFTRLDREARPGSIGFPVWGVEVRLVDADDQT